jgi:peptide/nickel transport system substrate-binding protein
VQLDCPNNRYINDEKICVAVAGMLAKVASRSR